MHILFFPLFFRPLKYVPCRLQLGKSERPRGEQPCEDFAHILSGTCISGRDAEKLQCVLMFLKGRHHSSSFSLSASSLSLASILTRKALANFARSSSFIGCTNLPLG